MSISSTLVHGAEIRFQEAADALRPYVGCFWVITAERNAIIRVARRHHGDLHSIAEDPAGRMVLAWSTAAAG
jgi:hypothetical protein